MEDPDAVLAGMGHLLVEMKSLIEQLGENPLIAHSTIVAFDNAADDFDILLEMGT